MNDDRIPLINTVVGSRLHGLATDESDYDFRTVFVYDDNMILLTPFTKPQRVIVHQADGIDTTGYEVGHFMYLAAKCNPSILEILFTPTNLMNYITLYGKWLTNNRQAFLNSKMIRDSHLGMAHAQLLRFQNSDNEVRRGKTLASCIRTLSQGMSLLQTKDYDPSHPDHKELLVALRQFEDSDVIEEAKSLIYVQLKQFDKIYEELDVHFTPDYELLNTVLRDIYKSCQL